MVAHLKEKKIVGTIGMRLVPFSKDRDLYREQNVAQGGNLEKTMSLHSKTENLNHQAIETWESTKEFWGQKKWNTSSKQQFIIHELLSQSSGQANYIWSSNIRNTNLEASNAQICKWLMKHPHSYTSSCDHNSAPQEDPLGSCISYIACIHLHSSVVKYLPCMVKNFDCTKTLLLTFKISVAKYRKVVRV